MNLLVNRNRQTENLWFPVGEMGRTDRESGMDMYMLLYFKWITNTYCIAHGALFNVMW